MSAPLRLGIVGCGNVVEWYHLPALARVADWELVAACDPMPQRRAWIAAAHPDLPVFDDLEGLLRGPALDALLIATPPATHAALARRALDAGLHVLVEKPLALQPTEAVALRDAAQQRGRQLGVGFNRRFRSAYVALRKRLASLPPGQLGAIRVAMTFDADRWHSHDAATADARGVGPLDDIASHQIDLLTWLFDRSVVAVRAEPLGAASPGGLRYQLRLAGGLEATCMASHGERYHEQLAVEAGGRWLLAYPAGLLVTASPEAPWVQGYCRLHAAGQLLGHKLARTPTSAAQSFAAQLQSFAAAIRGTADGPAGADAGVHAVAVIAACRESLAAGGTWQPVPHTKEPTP